jgi:hypothetical protein
VVAEVAPGRDVGGGKEERRQDDKENDVWVELEVRSPREKAEDQSADDEDDRVGNLEAFGEGGETGDKEEEEKENGFDAVDAGGLHGGDTGKIAQMGTASTWRRRRISNRAGCKRFRQRGVVRPRHGNLYGHRQPERRTLSPNSDSA